MHVHTTKENGSFRTKGLAHALMLRQVEVYHDYTICQYPKRKSPKKRKGLGGMQRATFFEFIKMPGATDE